MTIEDAKESIRKAIKQHAGYSHNVCSLTLASVAKEYGFAAANKLVDEFKLTQRYGIYKQKEE